jgi:ankyrin repeat protein
MFNRDDRHCPVTTWASTLLLLSGLVVAATAAGTNDSRLLDAARTQDAKTVRALLSQKADVNARSSDGSTALLWLAHWNDVETADLLLRAGADANAVNDFHMTPLSQACTNGSAEFVRLLLKSGANPNTPIATGETPLLTCAKTGNADAVRLLVESGAAVNAAEPTQNQTALMWAAAERHANVVSALIAAHADLRAHTKDGFTAIHFAARVGDLESLQLLLAAGVPVNILTAGGESAGAGTGGGGRGGGGATGGYTPLLIATLRAQVMSRCICWSMAPIPTWIRPALRRCIGPRPVGKATPRIQCTDLKTPCPEFRIVKPSCGWCEPCWPTAQT